MCCCARRYIDREAVQRSRSLCICRFADFISLVVDSPGALLSAAVSGGLLDEAALGALLLSVFRPSLCGILLTNDGREAVAATMSVTVSDIMKRGGPDAMRAMRGAAERVLSRELVNLNGFDYARYAKISHPELVSIFGGNRLLCCEFGDLVPAGSASSLLRFAIGMPATAPPVEVQVRGRAAARPRSVWSCLKRDSCTTRLGRVP